MIHLDADITFPPTSFAALLGCLLADDRDVAMGLRRPDPSARRPGQRAGAWQLNAAARAACRLPDDEPRAEGSFVALSPTFLEEFRYPIGGVSPLDDVSLVSVVRSRGRRAGNAWAAWTLAIPSGSASDFASQTQRMFAGTPDFSRTPGQLLAALHEGVRDPIGAAAYVAFRLLARARRSSAQPLNAETEVWDRAETTLRRHEE